MGMNECDDGNKINGDGCSSKCTIEAGYKCTSRKGLPDLCVDIYPPDGILLIQRGNVLVLLFTESVKSKVNHETLAKTMELSMKHPCKLDWTLKSTFDENNEIDKLVINVSPKCNIIAKGNYYLLKFNNPSLIKDLNNNSLVTNLFKVKPLEYRYKPIESSVILVGSIINYASLFILWFMIIISIFQSIAVGSVWNFVNMLQMISYLPILNLHIPSNLEIVLTEYLRAKEAVIPLRMLPDFIWNPLKYLAIFVTESFNEKFELLEYDTISFIVNYFEDLLTWLILLLVYVFLILLGYTCPKLG